MIGLFNYYRMKTNEDDEVVFQRVKEEDITICGKTIEEVIRILKGLELEKDYVSKDKLKEVLEIIKYASDTSSPDLIKVKNELINIIKGR